MLAGLAWLGAGGQVHQAEFRFSQGALRDDEIFDSALAVPGRYMVEIARRLLQKCPDATWLAIGNPLLPLRSDLFVLWHKAVPDRPRVVADQDGFPLFYILPRRCLIEFERFLLLLSAQDGQLDSDLLAALLGEDVDLRKLAFGPVGEPPGRGPNGWLNGDRRLLALKLQALRGIDIIRTSPDWRRLPFAVYYPMHAGDVLFMAMASTLVPATPFSKQIVCSAYADIPPACGSKLETMRLKLPWISRDGSVSEADYFTRALERLGPAADGHFIVFSRILRLYYQTPFHLIDHARFALGESFISFGQTLHGGANANRGRCDMPATPLRVLFHLNGGWTLKNYPQKSIHTIVACLRAMDIEVGVIDRPELAALGAIALKSESSDDLRRHIEAHHLFVGVDSFPHHFARIRMGWPTIGLFGNTKPTNSDAAYGEDYRTSEMNLSCNRCGAYDQCPAFGGNECANYAPPATVVSDILTMAEQVYGYRA